MHSFLGYVTMISTNSYAFTLLILFSVLLFVVFIILVYASYNKFVRKTDSEDAEQDNKNKLKGDHKLPFSKKIKRTFFYIKPQLWRFVLALLLIVAQVGFDVVFPMLMKDITNELQKADPVWSYILGIGLGYLGLVIVGQIVLYFESIILQKAGQTIIYNLRMEVFTHIENMSQDQFNDMPVGSLVTRVASYTANMSDLFTNTLVNLLRNILTIFSVYIMMIVLSPSLSLWMLLFVTAVFIISLFFRNIVHKIFSNERRYVSDLNAFLNESLSGMKIIQVFNQEKRKEEEFNVKNENIRRERYRLTIAFAAYRPLINALYYGAVALIFFLGTRKDSGLLGGEIVAFYLYLSKFFNPVQNIADQINNIQSATTASERLFNLLDVQPKVIDAPDAIEIEHFDGKIEFRNVWFAYEKEHWILRNVSFTINPRETCAFVGATGAGKTTILSLIVRNYEIQKGQILIDDIDITHIKVESLRRAIGQMLQDVFLFSGNIRDNITLHDERFSDDEINETCEYVNADKFINKLDKKLDEQVIARGENFSQGERQLLSFARTVLHKPQILILDEATANIDTETEVLIQESLEKIKNIGTMLVVAHRLSTIQKADQIIVLQNGEVIEKGNHQSLLKQKGHYYKLYELQFEEVA